MKEEVQIHLDEMATSEQSQGTQQEIEPFKQPNPTYQSFPDTLLIIIAISISSFYVGFTLIYFNVLSFDSIMIIFQIEMDRSKAQGFLTFCIPLGGLIGSYSSSYFINNMGRRQSILYINYAALVLGVLVLIPNLKTLIVVRISQGICAGLFSSLVPLLIKETAPFELYGSLGVIHNTLICVGIFFACILSYVCKLITEDLTGLSFWHLIFGFPLLTLSIQTIILLFVIPFDTPQYLIATNQEERALRVISYIYKEECIDEIVKTYKSNMKHEPQEEGRSQDNHYLKEEQSLTITKLISLHLSLLQQFVGISAVSIYASQIASTKLPAFQDVLPSLLNFLQVISGILSSFLLRTHGSKWILQGGTLASVATNICIAIGFFIINVNRNAGTVFILFGLVLFIFNFGMTLGPIVFVIIPQIVNSKFLPFAVMMNWAGAAISLLLFPIILQYLPNKNPAYLFVFFGGWSLVSYFINQKYIIETTGKSVKQIKEEYKRLQIGYRNN